jgi:hypothetical protein
MRQDIERHQNFCLRCQQGKNQQTKGLHWHLSRYRTFQTSGFTPTFLAQCSQQTVIKNLSFASWTLSLSTLWSLQSPTRRLDWFAKFGIPVQIHTDGGKEFVNKLSAELFQLLNVFHTKTSPAHPQCNAQVEVFNKTVKRFLQSFVDDTTLNWETFLPALAISYNTSYHSTIATTPFQLLFGEKARLPSFPNEDIQQIHMAKLQRLKDSICYKNYELKHIKVQLSMDSNQNPHLIKIQCHITSKSVTKF